MRSAGVIVAIALMLSACGDTPQNQVGRLEWFLSWNKIGSSRDYLLVKSGLAGRDPVAVVFGFMDDGAFCNEVAQMYMQRYPSDRYYCEPVNK